MGNKGEKISTDEKSHMRISHRVPSHKNAPAWEKSMKKLGSLIIAVILILSSYMPLFLLNKRTNFLSWILLVLSLVLFIAGWSVIAMNFNKPLGRISSVIRKLLLGILGSGMILIGCYAIYKDNLSSRGIFVFTVLLIEGLSLFVSAAGKAFNALLDGMQIVEGMTDEIETVYTKFKEVDTPFGKPWIGTIKPGDMTCLIYGPTQDGEFLYGCYEMGQFYFGENSSEQFLDKEQCKKHRIQRRISEKDFPLNEVYDLEAMLYPVKYKHMFEHYVKTGEAVWTDGDKNQKTIGKMYVFDGDFSLVGQKYHLVDTDGKNVYDISGTIPLKRFCIRDSRDQSEVFRITKRLFHIFPHYDLYKNGEKYGRIMQNAKLLHDTFSMKTADGKLVMREVTATIGENYAVYLDEQLIGTISERISLRLHDIVYDNFVLMVFDERQRALLTVLAIMAQRELMRDRAGTI